MDTNTVLAERFSDVNMFRACEQCGCCASACPITGVRDFNVRRIVRHIELDLVNEIASTPLPWLCTTCGRCESVCPNGIAILDIMRPLRSMAPDELVPIGPPPCGKGCPAEIDIPSYLRFVAEGKAEEACAVILEKVPFPGILGRVCMHPCETKCRRGEVNQPISICALKRYAADHAGEVFKERNMKVGADTGKKAAVIGAGPAGLTTAFYLRKKGHAVTLFEAREKAGGMMRYGIPRYRLPEEVLDREIAQVLNTGIQLETGKKLGRDFTLEGLKKEGFDAVFLGTGLQQSRRIQLEGADHADVLWGVDFLSAVAGGEDVALKDRVLVVGGGNVAIDVALTALRVGANHVTLACLESRDEMPANDWEIDMAEEEGVKLLPSWGPSRILHENGKISGIELVQCTSVFDDGGKFCPAFGEAKETVAADQVILAIGQAADLAFAKDGGLKVERGLIVTDPETQATSMEGVFCGGDVGRGPGAIIDAIAAGRRAASSIDRMLGGDGNISETLAERPEWPYDGKRERGFADLTRIPTPTLSLGDRRQGFSEVDLCFSAEQAMAEARRCLQCDLEKRLAEALKQ